MQDDTVNAAAVVLAAAARSTTGLLPHHQHQQQVQDHARAATKTRSWWWRLKAKLLCFRRAPHGRHPRRRIADYASPEPALSSSSTTSYHTHRATRPAMAFVAPPPSPASSVLTSESPSPSPAHLLRGLSASGYSSPTTASAFAVGPYAREPQQPVSPPAFSAGVTEPSTAPLTPSPESAAACCSCLQQPGSSPEVPFARFLLPSSFQGYQLQQEPGSPIGGTIVSSPVSTSSSPPAWLRRRSSEEGSPPSGEFAFGRVAGARTAFADGGDGGRGASVSSIGDDAAAEDGNQQWPFSSSFPN